MSSGISTLLTLLSNLMSNMVGQTDAKVLFICLIVQHPTEDMHLKDYKRSTQTR